MKKVRVFAPASIANLGCGFDIMGLALDEVGDILEMTASEGDGITITNQTDVPLPEDIEDNVITPVIRKFLEMTGQKAQIDVTVCQKIYPGSGIGSSAASSAAAAYGMNELFDCLHRSCQVDQDESPRSAYFGRYLQPVVCLPRQQCRA